MALGYRSFKLRVVDSKSLSAYSSEGDITSGCLVFVHTASTKTLATIYKNKTGAALSNPISRSQFATDTKVIFWGPDAAYDVVVCHQDGSVGVFSGVTPNTHSLKLDRSNPFKHLVVPFTALTAETDTGIDLPRFVLVKPLIIEVVTAEAAKTIDVGLLAGESGGDADGFTKAASLATAGYVRPWGITAGSNETFVAAPTVGALIGAGSAGTDVANDFGHTGGYGHIVTSASAVSVTYTCSAATASAAGYIHIPFQHLR